MGVAPPSKSGKTPRTSSRAGEGSRDKSRDDGPLGSVVSDDVSRDVDRSLRSPVTRSTRAEPQDQAGGELRADLIRRSVHD